MKLIKILITAIVIASTSFSMAFTGMKNSGTFINNSNTLKQRIVSMIHVPVPADGQMEGKVEVTFRITDKGRVELIDIVGDHDYMVDQVREDIQDQRLRTAPELQNNVYKMKLHYGETLI